MLDLDLVRHYEPHLYFDRHEPFYPDRIGVTIINKPGPSPSFRRQFAFEDERLSFVIEYAIYWDFDIQHLYELEHVWVYVGKDGSVIDCEASFHGRYLKGLLKDRSNLAGTHVQLYSQPGKHAFSPLLEVFELLPDLMTCTDEDAGKAGLLITGAFDGTYETNTHYDALVREFLRQHYRFKPTMEFEHHALSSDLYVSWDALYEEVPQRIKHIIAQLEAKSGPIYDLLSDA